MGMVFLARTWNRNLFGNIGVRPVSPDQESVKK